RGSFGRGRAAIALAALHLLQDDTVEQHGQLGGADLDASRAVIDHSGEAKHAFFESLIPQAPAVLLPREDLEAIANAVAENEPVPRKGIIAEGLADEGAETVERLAEIDDWQAEEDTDGRRQAQHDGSSRAARRRRRATGSKPWGMRRSRPLPRTSSSAGPGSGESWRTSRGTKVTGSSAAAAGDGCWPR